MTTEKIENVIYASIIRYCESKEKTEIKNGHHLAQKITELVAADLQKLFDKTLSTATAQTKAEVYDVMFDTTQNAES
jgi:vacuolar-type H+-ATPase subunit H